MRRGTRQLTGGNRRSRILEKCKGGTECRRLNPHFIGWCVVPASALGMVRIHPRRERLRIRGKPGVALRSIEDRHSQAYEHAMKKSEPGWGRR
jgi:hypothetical protein